MALVFGVLDKFSFVDAVVDPGPEQRGLVHRCSGPSDARANWIGSREQWLSEVRSQSSGVDVGDLGWPSHLAMDEAMLA